MEVISRHFLCGSVFEVLPLWRCLMSAYVESFFFRYCLYGDVFKVLLCMEVFLSYYLHRGIVEILPHGGVFEGLRTYFRGTASLEVFSRCCAKSSQFACRENM